MIRKHSQQTQAQWLSDFTGEPVEQVQADLDQIYSRMDRRTGPSDNTPGESKPGQNYSFAGFRTTQKGALVLDFVDRDSGEIASAFFNVSIEFQRGPKAGQERRTGTNGQFFPRPRSKFRKFWTETIGHPPRRWSEVHKQMHLLSKVTFSGSVESATFASGEEYLRLKNVRKIADNPVTRKRQHCDNAVTTKRQRSATSKPRKPKPQKAFKQTKLHDKRSAQIHDNTSAQTHNSCYVSSFVEVF